VLAGPQTTRTILRLASLSLLGLCTAFTPPPAAGPASQPAARLLSGSVFSLLSPAAVRAFRASAPLAMSTEQGAGKPRARIDRMSDTRLQGLTDAAVLDAVHALLYQGEPRSAFAIKNCSGQSGAKTYLVSSSEPAAPRCIVKVAGADGEKPALFNHANSRKRMVAGARAFRASGVAPQLLVTGPDFHVEAAVGTSVLKDFFTFDTSAETGVALKEVAGLLARVHATSTDWWAPLQAEFLARDPALAAVLAKAPPYAPCWNLPWSGYDTGMVVLGKGTPDPTTAQDILAHMVSTGVWEKLMLCEAFHPVSEGGRRMVVTHNDFKVDNVLRGFDGAAWAIDYDLVQVSAAVQDFGIPYMMWLGCRFTEYETRRAFVLDYLEAAGLACDAAAVRAMMLDCEVNTIVAFPGLLSHIYDAQVPLLRGFRHKTAAFPAMAGSPDDSPTGLEIVDLMAAAVTKVRADEVLIDAALREGLVPAIHNRDGLGEAKLMSWLEEMRQMKMLRLFGIMPKDA